MFMFKRFNTNHYENHNDFLQKIKFEKRTILIVQILIFIISMTLWEFAARMQWIDTFLTSYPSAVWNLFVKLVKSGSLFEHVSVSVIGGQILFPKY